MTLYEMFASDGPTASFACCKTVQAVKSVPASVLDDASSALSRDALLGSQTPRRAVAAAARQPGPPPRAEAAEGSRTMVVWARTLLLLAVSAAAEDPHLACGRRPSSRTTADCRRPSRSTKTC